MRGSRRERHGELELAVLAVAHAGDHRRRRAGRGRRGRAPRAPARAARLRARAARQNRNEWPACACTASATLSSAVKCGNSDVIWNERASPSRLRSIDRQRGDVAAVEMDAAGVGRDLAGELADQRGLAGAVRADDGVQLAARDIERARRRTRPRRRSAWSGLRSASSASATAQPRQKAVDAAARVKRDQQQHRAEMTASIRALELVVKLRQQPSSSSRTRPRRSPGRTPCPCRPAPP